MNNLYYTQIIQISDVREFGQLSFIFEGFLGGASGEESEMQGRSMGSIPGLERYSGVGNGNRLTRALRKYSC